MTAEVAILNQIGVALAADSAISVGQSADKIYTSSDKLFQLSTVAPVGIMIYGNANFVSVPWETIVKQFRRKLGKNRAATVKTYADQFLRYLRRNREMFPKSNQDEQVVRLVMQLFRWIRNEIKKTLDKEAEKRQGLEEKEIPPIVDEVITRLLASVKVRERLPGFQRSVLSRIRSRLHRRIGVCRGHVFGKLPMSRRTVMKIESIAIEMLGRHSMGPLQAGFVIAGFGEREFMPCLYSYQIEEMVNNIPRCKLATEQRIDINNTAVIVPFAQQEMVHLFMEGIDIQLRAYMHTSTITLFNGVLDLILDAVGRSDSQLGKRLGGIVRPEIKKMLDNLADEWKKGSENLWTPIIHLVASLPKDELASMAEALVNLTSFRRRVMPERETVGGPIDVAVITKGDGFVWVKRKHYFEAAFNPRIMARYMQGE